MWKDGEATRGSPRFCDAPTRSLADGGGAYCPAHAAVCFTSDNGSGKARTISLRGVPASALSTPIHSRESGDPLPLTGEVV